MSLAYKLFTMFLIYQLRNEDSTRDYRFEPYDRLQAAGRTVDKSNYTEVYTAPLAAGTTLEDIYRTFNVDHPADFKGHSLSVSDVVVLHQNGHDTAHYCDSVGFQQVPEFLRENPLRTAELSTEQNENMIDGVLNNAPSLGELEAKAGEQISLTDLAAAAAAFDTVVNTIPAPVLTAQVLAALPKGCLIVDLASKPGGTDFAAARRLGHTALHALSLPTVWAPETAGEALARTVQAILQEREEKI